MSDEVLEDAIEELGGKKRRRPGFCWYIWSGLNNERLWILFLYITSIILNSAEIGLVWNNNSVPIQVQGTQYYALLLGPSFGNFFTRGSCTSSAVNVIDLLSISNSFTPTTIAFLVFAFLSLLMMIIPICYAVIDLQGKITYGRMEPFYRGLLLSYALGMVFLYIIHVAILTFGLAFYTGSDSCWPDFLSNLQIRYGNATVTHMSSAVNKLNVADGLGGGCVILCFINILLYASLFCSRRTWYETEGLTFTAVKLEEFELA